MRFTSGPVYVSVFPLFSRVASFLEFPCSKRRSALFAFRFAFAAYARHSSLSSPRYRSRSMSEHLGTLQHRVAWSQLLLQYRVAWSQLLLQYCVALSRLRRAGSSVDMQDSVQCEVLFVAHRVRHEEQQD